MSIICQPFSQDSGTADVVSVGDCALKRRDGTVVYEAAADGDPIGDIVPSTAYTAANVLEKEKGFKSG